MVRYRRDGCVFAVIAALIAATTPVDAFERYHHSGGSSMASPPFPLQEAGDYIRSFRSPYPYADDTNKIGHWMASGDAVRASDETGKDVVRITSSLRSQEGALANTVVTAAGGGFDAYFDFTITKGPGSAEPADGLAFWYTERAVRPGPVHGGSADFKGLAIIVDTYSNNRRKKHPYIYAWVNDGTPNWVDNRDGEGVEVTKGCNLDIDKPVRLFVQWRNNKLKVAASFHGHAQWFYCFTADNVELPNTHGYFGFTASTGHFFASHDVSQAQIKAYAGQEDSSHRSSDFETQRVDRVEREPESVSGQGTYRDNRGAEPKTASYSDRQRSNDPPPYQNQAQDDTRRAPPPPPAVDDKQKLNENAPSVVDLSSVDTKLSVRIDQLSTELLSLLAQRDATNPNAAGTDSSNTLSQSTLTLLREVTSQKDLVSSSIGAGDDILVVAEQMADLAEDVLERTEELDDKIAMLYDVQHDLSELANDFHDEIANFEKASQPKSFTRGTPIFVLFVITVQASVVGLIFFVLRTQGGSKSSRFGV